MSAKAIFVFIGEKRRTRAIGIREGSAAPAPALSIKIPSDLLRHTGPPSDLEGPKKIEAQDGKDSDEKEDEDQNVNHGPHAHDHLPQHAAHAAAVLLQSSLD